MYDILQVTAEYSNAVLVAILPLVSDFAQKLELPPPAPITATQVASFKCSWRSDEIGGSLRLVGGYQFTFLDGRVGLYRSSESYFSLQDARRVPEFYGDVQITESQAVQVARDAVRKLGYPEAALGVDKKPVVKLPPRSGGRYIPRYLVKWLDTASRAPDATVEIEVNASNSRIEMISLLSPETFRPQPKVAVKAPVARAGPRTEPASSGRKIYPVSQAYSNAFLNAILPLFGDYARKGGFPVRLPVTADALDATNCTCGLVDQDPIAFINLKTGDRFVYGHGQVVAYYAPDVEQLPGRPARWGEGERFVGPINMTTNEAVALVRQTLRRLGYSEKVLHVDEPPTRLRAPAKWGTNFIARLFPYWREPDDGAFRVCAEVDATTRTLKSLYVNDHANTNIWHTPPRIDVPSEPLPDSETNRASGSAGDTPPPSKP